MGWNHEDWAWDTPVDSAAERLVLLNLNKRADDLDGTCYPSIKTIAEQTRLNRKTVQQAVRSLSDRGLIEVSKKDGKWVNLYRLNWGNAPKNGQAQKRTSPKTDKPKNGQRTSPKTGLVTGPKTGQETTNETTNETTRLNAADFAATQQQSDSLFGEELVQNKTAPTPRPKKPEKRSIALGSKDRPEGVNQETWDEVLYRRRQKRAPLTPLALLQIEREAQKAGISLQDALQEMVARGWQGFKADWHRSDTSCKAFTPRSRAELINTPEEELDYDWEAFFKKRKAENDKL